MSYRLKIDPKSRKAAKFISELQRKIQNELISSGMTQQEVAVALGVDRSVVNRRLKGSANLTARTISDFAHVFGKDVEIVFSDPDLERGANVPVTSGGILKIFDGQAGAQSSGGSKEKFTVESVVL